MHPPAGLEQPLRRRCLAVAMLVFAGSWQAPVAAQQSQQQAPVTRAELLRLTGDLEMQLRMTYHLDVRTLGLRRQQAWRAIRAWQRSPRKEEHNQLLAAWLQEATRRALPWRREPLPQVPGFQVVQQTTPMPAAPQAVANLPRVRAADSLASKATENSVHLRQRSRSTRPTWDGRQPSTPSDESLMWPAPRTSTGEPRPLLTAIDDVPSRRGKQRMPARPVNRAGPTNRRASGLAALPEVDALVPSPGRALGPATDAFVVSRANYQPAGPVSIDPAMVSLLPTAHPPLLETSVAAPRQTIRPEADLSVAVENCLACVDLNELRARIAGYHLGLRYIEAKLVTKRKHKSADLSRLADELGRLARQHGVLTMYCCALSEEQQNLVDAVQRPEGTIAMLADRVAKRRAELVRLTSPDAAAERQLLSKADERLNELTRWLKTEQGTAEENEPTP